MLKVDRTKATKEMRVPARVGPIPPGSIKSTWQALTIRQRHRCRKQLSRTKMGPSTSHGPSHSEKSLTLIRGITKPIGETAKGDSGYRSIREPDKQSWEQRLEQPVRNRWSSESQVRNRWLPAPEQPKSVGEHNKSSPAEALENNT